MFLDEGSLSFAHKEISHKVCGPTRSEKAHYFLVWVYRERFVIEGKKTKKEKERKKAGTWKARVIPGYQKFCLWFWKLKAQTFAVNFNIRHFYSFFLWSFKIMMRLLKKIKKSLETSWVCALGFSSLRLVGVKSLELPIRKRRRFITLYLFLVIFFVDIMLLLVPKHLIACTIIQSEVKFACWN